MFVSRVAERSVHERPATSDELALSFVISVMAEPDGFVGRVEFNDAGGSSVSRAVRGETCDEVVTGVALITALAIDGRAEAEPEPVAPTPAPAPAPAPDSASAPAPSPLTPAPLPREKPTTAFFTAGFGAGYVSAVGPSGGLGLAAFLALSSGPGGGSLRLGAWHWRASGSLGELDANFRAWGGRLDGCPLGLESGMWFVAPCGGFDLGLLRVGGVQSAALPEPKEASILWLDAAVLGRAGVVLGGLVQLEAEAGLSFPLVRKAFGFGDRSLTVYSVPDLGATAALNAGVRFR